MVIYLKHERHGTKVACSEVEAADDEKNGWVRFTLDPAVIVAKEVDHDRLIASGANLYEQYMTRFGKKPHHKKSEATIKRELDA